MDVDLGELSGFQFQQATSSSVLPLKVRAAEDRLLHDVVHAQDRPPTRRGSSPTQVAPRGWTASPTAASSSSWAIRVEVVLSASNPQSTQQTQVTVGTVTLGVVSSGVTLIQGTILSLLVRTTDYVTVYQEVQNVPINAGRGYANLVTGRRARHLGSLLVDGGDGAPKAADSSPR